MDTVTDRILLLALSVLAAAFHIDTSSLVIIFLVSAICSCICMYLDDERLSIIPAAACTLCAFFYPPFVYVLPVFVYDMMRAKKLYRYIPLGLAAAVVYFTGKSSADTAAVMTAAAVCIVSLVLADKTQRSTQLKKEIVRLKDTSRELSLLIEENKRNFITQQDYEVHAAMLAERNRIARDIHDNVGHLLSRSLLMIGALQAQTARPQDEDALAGPIADLRSTLSDAMDSIRQSVHDLHDESVDLENMLNKMASAFTFCPVTLDYDMKSSSPRDIKYCFLAVTREALSNTAKHSKASRVHIIVREHPALYQLLIEERTGGGSQTVPRSETVSMLPGGSRQTDPRSETVPMLPSGSRTERSSDQAAHNDGSGIGLENMTERVRQLGGTISISQTQEGWRIFISILKTSLKEGKS